MHCYCLPQPCEAAFVVRVSHVKERILQREQEITGEWLTEERMKAKHNWTKQLRLAMVTCIAGLLA